MEKYGYQGALKAKAGKGQELADILLGAASGEMPGCYVYMVAIDAQDSDLIRVTEVWESMEAHHQSLKLDSVKAAIAKAMPLLDGMPQKGIESRVLGGLTSDI